MSHGPVLIMAGGTGGHVFPALALARMLREQSRDVVWLGTRRGIEARVVPAEGFPVEWLSIGGLRGKGALTLLLAPVRLARALFEALSVMRRHRPVVVVGLGGFVSGPGGVAAWLCRRPLVVHEQNAVAGLTNRWLSRIARTVLTAFPGVFPVKIGAIEIGNPVRGDIAALPLPDERFAARGGAVRILVVGGSLGAARLNQSLPTAFASLLRSGTALEVRHQAGERHIEAARGAYAAAQVSAEVTPFIADMAEAYAWADLVVCRAGALTISELAAAGVGALLVPYPHAVDDHQTRNAAVLVDAGAARCVADHELTPDRAISELTSLCADRARLVSMARAARRLARPEATADLMRHSLAAAGDAR
jgi:UDP-N-acetylglucosamine--N-acetylmuramyl-(pentapeptide) pyrophosphoryl-undecaprenol N-acetylglucosamine transferase